MRNITLLFSFYCILLSSAEGMDVRLLANNKEAASKSISQREHLELEAWTAQHGWEAANLKPRLLRILKSSLERLSSNEVVCDLALPEILNAEVQRELGLVEYDDLKQVLRRMRVDNLIDDIFYGLAQTSMAVVKDLEAVSTASYPARPFNLHTRATYGTDVTKLYGAFRSTWPDETRSCSIGRLFRLARDFKWVTPQDRDRQIYRYNFMALESQVIDLATYHKLEVLRKHQVLSWDIYLDRYLDIIENAKDRLTVTPEASADSNFHNSYPHRRASLTQRESIFSRFDSTQVMLLAQVVQRTARRLDARYVSLSFQYTEDPEGEVETYVLSPMEQYRISIRMLRKEMARLMRSETFGGVRVEYEDLVSAAFETGLLKSDELEQVLSFEDLWDKKQPKWRSYLNFAYSLAGTSTYFLPAPFNIMGAIGLVLTQSLLTGKPDPDPEDNWNSVI